MYLFLRYCKTKVERVGESVERVEIETCCCYSIMYIKPSASALLA